MPDKDSNPLDYYDDVRPLLRLIRVMHRFFDEVVDEEPYRKFHPELYGAFEDTLKQELAPHALTLALAIVELEDAFPEIVSAREES